MADDAMDRLIAHFGLDREAARQATASAAGSALPWYLRVVTGIGAWLTAAAMIVAVGLVVVEAWDSDDLPLIVAGIGAVVTAGSMALFRVRRGEFTAQFAVAAALAGQAMIVGGIGLHLEDAVAAAAVAAGLTVVLASVRDPELQFLSSALAVGTVFLALVEREIPQPVGVLAAVTLPAALLLLLRPPAGADLGGLAWALLLGPLATMSVPEAGGLDGDWLPRAAYAGALLTVVALHWRTAEPGRRRVALAGAAVAMLVGAVAAAGIAGSLLLLVLAFLLGSRALAAVGAVSHVWFVSRFYYDLELTLLQKSAMLTATGLLLLGLWWLWARQGDEQEAAR